MFIGKHYYSGTPLKTGTTVTNDFVLYSEVPLGQGVVADRLPLIIVANYSIHENIRWTKFRQAQPPLYQLQKYSMD